VTFQRNRTSSIWGPRPTDVVDDEVAAGLGRFLDNDDSDVRHVVAEVSSNQVAGTVVRSNGGHRQRVPFAAKETHQVGYAAVVDVGVRARLRPLPPSRIRRKVVLHVLVDFFLQIDADGATGTDNFIGADPVPAGTSPLRYGMPT
jgi:hypothetical protein